MPFGLSNSPAIFRGFMNEIFRDLLNQFVVIYIDDVLIYSPDLTSHIHHVQTVLQRLRDYHLYLKLEKCEFHQSTIHFLGYVITPHGINMDQRKVEVVLHWPQPTTRKELQRFLGFANFYRRFIQNFSPISFPLTDLLKSGAKSLSWNTRATQAFQDLKSAFSSAPTLALPDPAVPFLVEVDASISGVGAVLSQRQGNPPQLHPCAFYSKKLSPAEQNYDIGNRELLAIKLALEEWRHWLEGAQHPFTVITDHRNLEYLQNDKRLNPCQARWALFFTRFNFSVTYSSGEKNVKADALSRQFQPETPPSEPESILPPAVVVSPIQWSLDDHIAEATLLEPAPPGGPEGRVYVPTRLRLSLMDSVHTSPGSGHPGSQSTLSLVQQRYWWPGMAQDVSRFVKGCSVCAMAKVPRHLPEGKLVPLPIPTRPWSHLGVDFVTDLPVSNNHTCILVVVDRFSKACKLIPLPGLPTALETAEALFQHIFRNFGIPEDVSNGQTERKIQEIGRYLRSYCHDHQDCWSRYLPWAEHAQNSLRQTTTGLTPFQCILGYQHPLFPWSGEPSDVPAVHHWFQTSERVWDSAHTHLQRAVRRHQNQANLRRTDAPHYLPGQLVWLSTRDIRLRQPCPRVLLQQRTE
ncbi:retrotransposable element [Pimephales promelas]|nr:retrotransposable element [Pimephales promelas]